MEAFILKVMSNNNEKEFIIIPTAEQEIRKEMEISGQNKLTPEIIVKAFTNLRQKHKNRKYLH